MNKIRIFMEVTNNSIGYDGGIYRAVAQGDDCILYKPNEDSIVVGIDRKEAGETIVYTSSMNITKVNTKKGTTYFLLKNPDPVKDLPSSDEPSLEMRRVAIGVSYGVLINKLFFDNITVDSNNLQISGYNSWVDDIALPKPGVGYFSMSQIKGRFDLDLTEYKCYRLQELYFNSIKIGKMGNPLVSSDNSYTNLVYLYGLNNVVEFGGLEPNIKTVYVTYCDDTTILSVLRGIDGRSATAGYVDVEISLREGQEITDEMNTIATQNGINIY